MHVDDFADLPDIHQLLTADGEYHWASDVRRMRFLGEVQAMRGSIEMGYLHHAELHRSQALELLRLDLAAKGAGE